MHKENPLSRELRILDWFWRFIAHPFDIVLLVLLEVSLEPNPLSLALGCEDVRREPVEEEAVVAHADDGARKLKNGLFVELRRRIRSCIGGKGCDMREIWA